MLQIRAMDQAGAGAGTDGLWLQHHNFACHDLSQGEQHGSGEPERRFFNFRQRDTVSRRGWEREGIDVFDGGFERAKWVAVVWEGPMYAGDADIAV